MYDMKWSQVDTGGAQNPAKKLLKMMMIRENLLTYGVANWSKLYKIYSVFHIGEYIL